MVDISDGQIKLHEASINQLITKLQCISYFSELN